MQYRGMSNAITVTARNGNVISFSAASDSRITKVVPGAMSVYCRSNAAACEMTREARAWGITSVMFDGPLAAEIMGAL